MTRSGRPGAFRTLSARGSSRAMELPRPGCPTRPPDIGVTWATCTASANLGSLASLRSLRPLLPLLLFGVAFASVRCSASSEDDGLQGATGTGGGEPRNNVDATWGYGGAGGSSLGASLNPLCGEAAEMGCVPDDEVSCDTTLGMGGAGGQSPLGGAAGLGGMAGSVSIPSDSGSLEPSGYSCHVVSIGGERRRSCELSGQGGPDAPCLSPAGCAAGLTCVGEGASGRCRPYCCRGATSCDGETFCSEEPVVGGTQDLTAPVCVRAEQCNLAEAYPCPDGTDCQCSGGTACMVVGSGITSCVAPGTGEEGDPCNPSEQASCAWGHYCHPTERCVKLCSTVSTKDECGTGRLCLSPAQSGSLPPDFGICTAGADSAR